MLNLSYFIDGNVVTEELDQTFTNSPPTMTACIVPKRKKLTLIVSIP